MTTAVTSALYLTRLVLKPRSRQVMSELAHPYEMHRTLMRAFPRATDEKRATARDEFGVLFRPDVDELNATVKVLIQSLVPPDWRFLEGLHDYLSVDEEFPGVPCKNILPSLQNLSNGRNLRFRMLANPSKRIANPGDRMKCKRVELAREDEQIAWLIRKGHEREKGVLGGFELVMKEVKDASGETTRVPHVNVCPEGKQKGRKRDPGAGNQTTHLAVLFEGVLRITDKDAFVQTIIQGIGSGKAFGFGLLSVAPCPSPDLKA